MSKMSELDLAVKELHAATEALITIADNLKGLFSKPKQKPITLEQVRAVLADKSRDGYTAEVRALLVKHGAEKLSDIKPGKYAALLTDVEALGNG